MNEESQWAFSTAMRAIRRGSLVPAFEGHTPTGLGLAKLIAQQLDLESVVYTITENTSYRHIVGDLRNPVTFELSDFVRLMRNGGVFIIHVPLLSPQIAKGLTNFTLFFPETNYWLEPYGYPENFRPHSDFHMIFNLPSPQQWGHLPSELATMMQFIWMEEDKSIAEDNTDTVPLNTGPGTVLVLMKFGIPEYEAWFRDVIEPTVGKLGICIRLMKGLNDWQSAITQVLQRADAALMDLSHDLTGDLSPNVRWELNQLWRELQARRSSHEKGLNRDRLIFFARGLEHLKSQHADADYLYSSEVNKEWIVGLPRRSLNVEDLIGFRIRKYHPEDRENIERFKDWLNECLSPWVQGIPAPLTDEDLRNKALASLQQASGNNLAKEWISAIGTRDIKKCGKLADRADIPEEALEILGCLLSTVSVADAHKIKHYWTLAKGCVSNSLMLRHHYYQLLKTEHLHRQHWVTNNFRENLWHCFSHAAESFPKDERKTLAELSRLETDRDIKLVVDSVIISMMPEDKQREARQRYISRFYGVDSGDPMEFMDDL